ncbi:MAG: hypothetical protein R2766_10120 [Saprospiraceae bacterium]
MQADDFGCEIAERVIIETFDPAKLNLEDKYSICEGQSISIDVEDNDSWVYIWREAVPPYNGLGNNTNTIDLDSGGIYILQVYDDNGCTVSTKNLKL